MVNAYVGPALARYLESLRRPPREPGLSRRRPDHAVARRRRRRSRVDAAGGGRRPVRTRGRRRRRALLRAAARRGEPDHLRHGRHQHRRRAAPAAASRSSRARRPWASRRSRCRRSTSTPSAPAAARSRGWTRAGSCTSAPRARAPSPAPPATARAAPRATVTDANLVLGFLDPGNFLGGRIALDAAAARARRRAGGDAARHDALARGGRHRPGRQHQHGGRDQDRLGAPRRRPASVRAGGLRRRRGPARHRGRAAPRDPARRRAVRRRRALGVGHAGDRPPLRARALTRERGVTDDAGRPAPALRRARARGPQAPRPLRRSRSASVGRSTCATASRSSRSRWTSTASTSGPPDLMDQVAARFHRRHEELYAYSAPGQEVVVVNARVAVVGELPALPAGSGAAERRRPRRSPAGVSGWATGSSARLPDGRARGRPGDQGPGASSSRPRPRCWRARASGSTVTPHGWLDIRLG